MKQNRSIDRKVKTDHAPERKNPPSPPDPKQSALPSQAELDKAGTEGKAEVRTAIARGPARVDWCVMYYLAGDNDLSDEMVRTLAAVRAPGGTSTKVAVFAQFDCSHPAIKTRRINLQLAPTSSRPNWYEVEEEASATEQAIYDFVKVCLKGDPLNPTVFPGCLPQNYALVLSGHGDGIQGRTLLLDDSPYGVLTIPELRSGLRKIKNSLTIKPVDVLGIDSCLMNSLEVSYEIRDCAKLLVASQGTIPNAGWDLAKISDNFNNAGSSGPITAEYVSSEIMAKSLRESNRPFAKGLGRSVDLSVCDLEHFAEPSNVLTDLEQLARKLSEAIDRPKLPGNETPAQKKDRALSNRIAVRLISLAHLRCQRFLSNQSVDLYDFCKILISEIDHHKETVKSSGLSNERLRLLTLLDEIAVLCGKVMAQIDGKALPPVPKRLTQAGVYSGADSQFANGVSLFFPWSELSYFMTKAGYENLDFLNSKAGAEWIKFVKALARATMRKPRDPESKNYPPFYKTYPPFYKGAKAFLEYFDRVTNFPNNWSEAEGLTTDPYNVE